MFLYTWHHSQIHMHSSMPDHFAPAEIENDQSQALTMLAAQDVKSSSLHITLVGTVGTRSSRAFLECSGGE